jgi:hypothetical protein
MKDLNKKSAFEEHWEEVFQEAEMTPSEGVWDKIDAALSKEEAGYFKRKAFIFKLLAAASIAFALGIGIFSLNHYLDDPNQTEIAQYGQRDQDQSNNEISQAIDSEQEPQSIASSAGHTGNSEKSDVNNSEADTNGNSTIQLAVIGNTPDGSSEATMANNHPGKHSIDAVFPVAEISGSNIEGDRDQEPQFSFNSFQELFPQGIDSNAKDETMGEIDHIYLIPVMPRGASKIRRNSEDTGMLMASLDFSAGQFNPNFQQGSSGFVAPNASYAFDSRTEMTSFNATNKDFLQVRSSGEETKPEVAFSYGANVGFMVSKRILLQTGIAYRKANTTTTTTGYFENLESNSRVPIVASYQYKLGGLSSVKRIDETSLNNQYEFASIPLRAGYIIVNRKVNVTLLAGVSSEFFINNSIVDDSNFLQTISSDDASDSPYKNVYFNGSLGTMLGYTFAGNYMFTIEPSYRVALNSFTKDSFYLSSYPSSFMVSFGVAYNFK